jgi:hypothetical protein
MKLTFSTPKCVEGRVHDLSIRVTEGADGRALVALHGFDQDSTPSDFVFQWRDHTEAAHPGSHVLVHVIGAGAVGGVAAVLFCKSAAMDNN